MGVPVATHTARFSGKRRVAVKLARASRPTGVEAPVAPMDAPATPSKALRLTVSRRSSDGALEFFYGTNAAGEIDMDDRTHGHAVIKNGELVYKRRPGESHPVVDKD